jgi:hypothetical protein
MNHSFWLLELFGLSITTSVPAPTPPPPAAPAPLLPTNKPFLWYEEYGQQQVQYIASLKVYDIVMFLACVSVICLTVYVLLDKIIAVIKFIVYWFFFILGLIHFIKYEPVRVIFKRIIDAIINLI